MDLSAAALLIFAVVVFGGILIGGLAVLIQVRNGQRDRLQMKRHVQRIDVGSEK